MILVIAEKEALGKYIAEALPGVEKTSKSGAMGRIEKGEYIVVWTNGHLLTLKDPDEIDKKYKKWSLDTLPIYFDPWEKRVVKDAFQKKGQKNYKEIRVKEIGTLLKQADEVIHAGDIDEEGQLLVDELLEWHHYKGPVRRLDTSNTAIPKLKENLQHMQDNRNFIASGKSADARGIGDKTFGYTLSRYYTIVNNNSKPLSVGRVATATLGLVVNRDLSIEGHHKTVYYNLLVSVDISGTTVVCRYVPSKDNIDLTDGKYLNVEPLYEVGNNLPDVFESVEITKSIEKEAPPLPFNLNKLNLYCSKVFGYKPDAVMQITQTLRDDFNAITYNRSDCQYLGEDHFKEAPKTVAMAASNLGIDPGVFDTSIKSKCFNDDNITAHFAIIPTCEEVNVDQMNDKQRNVYTAICYQYFAQFMPPASKETTKLSIALDDGGTLTASSTKIVKQGYRELLQNTKNKKNEDQSDGLELFDSGTYKGKLLNCNVEEKVTKPQPRYTQATLAEDMTRVSKYVKDPKMKAVLLAKDKGKKGENGSIGTSATRAIIIGNLINHGFLKEEKKGKKDVLLSTDVGRTFYLALPDNIKTAEVTARWWSIQEDIKNGNATKETLLNSILSEINEVISSDNGAVKGLYVEEKDYGKCPQCGKPLRKRNGPKGEFISCSGYPDCRYIQKQPATVVGKCPQCGKDLVTRKGKYGTFISCTGYPECKYIKK